MLTITDMKILKSNYITPFGGLNFVLEELENLKIDKILHENLPTLAPQSFYNWKDIFYSFWSLYFCGGDCIEDLSGNFKKSLQEVPFINIPSPDRVLDRIQELSIPVDEFTVPRGVAIHEFSMNKRLNTLNIKLLKRFKALNKKGNVLDYDNTLIYTNKSSARMSYKKQNAYCPGVGLIGKQVVFIENRNGNSAAKDLQSHTLKRMFDLFKEEDIEIDTFRADSASFDMDILSVVRENCKNLFVKARMSPTLAQAISDITIWEKLSETDEEAYIGETTYIPFVKIAKRRKKDQNELGEYRLVVKKVPRKDGQINLFTNEAYNYSAIITLEKEMTNEQVYHYYNQRGTSEKEFDVLKNDFGWQKLPSSKIEINTVYLIMAAMCRNIYDYIINLFSEKFKNLQPNFRIKKFIFRFISIPAKWIRTGRYDVLRLYGDLE